MENLEILGYACFMAAWVLLFICLPYEYVKYKRELKKQRDTTSLTKRN